MFKYFFVLFYPYVATRVLLIIRSQSVLFSIRSIFEFFGFYYEIIISFSDSITK